MTKSLKLSLLALFLFQVVIASQFELAHDEAYYWLYSKNLDWGYFDHPPFVGLVIKAFSFLGHNELALRFGFIVLQFATMLILLGISGSAWVSYFLFFAFPLASFTGVLALPDMPLLFMAAVYCHYLKKYFEKDSLKNSILLGVSIAVLFYAKYHGVLLVFFTMVAVPKLLLRKSFYGVALVALLCFMPHMIWQYQHDFSTLRYHFIERPSSSFSLKRSLEFVGLQVILAGVFAGFILWWDVIKKKSTDNFSRSMKFISIGTVLFFLFSSLSKKTEANWTIFLTIPLIYLTSGSLVWLKKWPKIILTFSFALVVLLRVVFVLPPDLVKIKRAHEFHGWKDWAQKIKADCGDLGIVANTYQVASKLSYYLNQEIGSLNIHSRKNQFDYWQFEKNLPTKEVCYVTNNTDVGGEEVFTPEGKSLRIVKNQSIESLMKLK